MMMNDVTNYACEWRVMMNDVFSFDMTSNSRNDLCCKDVVMLMCLSWGI